MIPIKVERIITMRKIPTTCKSCKHRFESYQDFIQASCNQEGCTKNMGRKSRRLWLASDNKDRQVVVEHKIGRFAQLEVPKIPLDKQVYEEVERPVAIRVYFR